MCVRARARSGDNANCCGVVTCLTDDKVCGVAPQSQIDRFAANYCADQCAVLLEPKWLSCNRGFFMLETVEDLLTPFADVSDLFCEMADKASTGPGAVLGLGLDPEGEYKWVYTIISLLGLLSSAFGCFQGYKKWQNRKK